jgi:hypothetical protein
MSHTHVRRELYHGTVFLFSCSPHEAHLSLRILTLFSIQVLYQCMLREKKLSKFTFIGLTGSQLYLGNHEQLKNSLCPLVNTKSYGSGCYDLKAWTF